MHYFKVIILMILLAGCGKSPIFNKAAKSVGHIVGNEEYSESGKLDFNFSWTIPPSLDELASFTVKLDRPLKDTQSIQTYLWMPDMGHGSSPIEMQIISPTEIQFTELAFIMPGLWVLHINLIENDKVIDQWQKAITL